MIERLTGKIQIQIEFSVYSKCSSISKTTKYGEIPLLRPPEIKTSYLLKSLICKV